MNEDFLFHPAIVADRVPDQNAEVHPGGPQTEKEGEIQLIPPRAVKLINKLQTQRVLPDLGGGEYFTDTTPLNKLTEWSGFQGIKSLKPTIDDFIARYSQAMQLSHPQFEEQILDFLHNNTVFWRLIDPTQEMNTVFLQQPARVNEVGGSLNNNAQDLAELIKIIEPLEESKP